MKARPSWSAKHCLSIALNAALALILLFLSPKGHAIFLDLFSYFPHSTVHHWMFCCLGNSIWGQLSTTRYWRIF